MPASHDEVAFSAFDSLRSGIVSTGAILRHPTRISKKVKAATATVSLARRGHDCPARRQTGGTYHKRAGI